MLHIFINPYPIIVSLELFISYTFPLVLRVDGRDSLHVKLDINATYFSRSIGFAVGLWKEIQKTCIICFSGHRKQLDTHGEIFILPTKAKDNGKQNVWYNPQDTGSMLASALEYIGR